MSSIIDKFKRDKISALVNNFNVTMNQLNNSLSINIKIIKKSRIQNKSKLIQRIINNYNNNIKIIKNKLNDDIKNINNFMGNFPTTFKNKKALLIGINYLNTEYELSGCIADTERMKTFLETKGFNNFDMMSDLTEIKPTRSNIFNKIINFINSSVDGDLLFIHFSGHGTYTYDTNGDEIDGNDELIVTSDLSYIMDDELKTLINQFSKKNVSIIGLFDSCHSGTIMDLKYNYNYLDNKYIENVKNSECNGNILMISGCMDDQTSSEAIINGSPQGALTSSFIEVMSSNLNCSWKELMCNMNNLLKSNNFTQIPQISTNVFCNIDGKVF
jgi:hypothetical protein